VKEGRYGKTLNERSNSITEPRVLITVTPEHIATRAPR
jgi:hypothetical protein